MAQETADASQPLTALAEDERIFRDTVRDFANAHVRPLVREMDEHAKIPRALIDRLFDLGVMGIEIPESYGGAGASFFTAILAVEELSRVDASVGVLVDVQNTLVNNALIRWGNPEQKTKYLNALATGTVGAYALSEAGSGSARPSGRGGRRRPRCRLRRARCPRRGRADAHRSACDRPCRSPP